MRSFARFAVVLTAAAAFVSAAPAGADTLAPMVDPGLPGPHRGESWTQLTAANHPGYGGFPGSAAWYAPVASDQAGTAVLEKVWGNAFFSSESLYSGSFSNVQNTANAGLEISESSPLAGLGTIVFQIQIGEAVGYDFFDHVGPVLNYNGGTQGLAAASSSVVRIDTGTTFPNPQSGDDEPIYTNTYLFTWNVASLGPIDSFQIQWTVVQHAQTYGLRLDQYGLAAVPEPTSLAMIGLVSLAVVRRRGR